MASEQPSSSAQANRPQNPNLQEEAPLPANDGRLTQQPQIRESGGPFSSLQGSPRQPTPPQQNSGRQNPTSIPNPALSPSDMERGIGGPPEIPVTRALSPRDTISQGLGAGHPPPAPVGGRPIDPFISSREGSPGRGNTMQEGTPLRGADSQGYRTEDFRDRFINVAGDYIDQNIPRIQHGDRDNSRPATNEGFGARLVQLASDYSQKNLGQGSTSPPAPIRSDSYGNANQGLGQRLVHVASDYVGQNYGSSHQHGPPQSQQESPSGGPQAGDRSESQSRPGFSRGDTALSTGEGFGTRLVHIGGDYVGQTYGSSSQHRDADHRSASQHGSPSSADRMIDRPEPHAQGGSHAPAHEGFGARLLHAAGDYVPAGLTTNLPSLPARLMHAAEDYGVRHRTIDTRRSGAPQSVIDHIVPVEIINEKMVAAQYVPGSVNSRIHATLKEATAERDKYAAKAKFTGLALNVAIGLQVLLGSLTTGLSAVAATSGKSAAIQTTILGGLATVVASYLARARGSNEPELSITRVKDLEQFLREVKNFMMDHGDEIGHAYDDKLEGYRKRFEELLGNGNGERKLSSVISSSQSYTNNHSGQNNMNTGPNHDRN